MNTHILDWQGPPIQVVGFGCQQQGLLPTSACAALASADCVVAAADHVKVLEREGLLPQSTKVLGVSESTGKTYRSIKRLVWAAYRHNSLRRSIIFWYR